MDHHQNKGILSELDAQKFFTKNNYIVSKPICEHTAKYDFLIDNGNGIKRVQAKTAYWEEQRKRYVCKVTYRDGNKAVKYTPNDIDILCAVEGDTNSIYVIPIEYIQSRYCLHLNPDNTVRTIEKNKIEQFRRDL